MPKVSGRQDFELVACTLAIPNLAHFELFRKPDGSLVLDWYTYEQDCHYFHEGSWDLPANALEMTITQYKLHRALAAANGASP